MMHKLWKKAKVIENSIFEKYMSPINNCFRPFDKFKIEIQTFIFRFCFYLNMKNKIQITDYYFHV